MIQTLSSSAQPVADVTFQRLLSSPDDPVLNRRFATEAEARGDIRHALAAIERALLTSPDDPALRADYRRLRNKLLPTTTVATVQTGLSFATNPRQAGSSSSLRRNDGVADAAVAIEDERTIGGVRLRSRAVAAGQLDRHTFDLDTGRILLESGPVFSLSRDVWVHLAPGTSVVWLDGRKLYDELSGTVTIGTVFRGLTQSVSLRYGLRRGNDDIGVSDSRAFTIDGRFVISPSLVRGDYFYFQPRFHLSDPYNQPSSAIIMDTIVGFDTPVARDLSPLAFREWGGRATYMLPFLGGKMFAGAGIGVYQRRYDTFVLDAAALSVGVPMETDKRRKDVYLEPTAHLVFPQALGPAFDLRVDYRFEDNSSNDSYRDFQNHVVGLRVIGRF